MGAIQNIIERMKGNRREIDETPDDETRDKYLKSLRRERRTQLEEVEKEQLKKRIAEFKKERMKRYMFGIKDNKKKKQEQLLKSLDDKKRKIKVLRNGESMLKNGKITKMNDSYSWISKSNL